MWYLLYKQLWRDSLWFAATNWYHRSKMSCQWLGFSQLGIMRDSSSVPSPYLTTCIITMHPAAAIALHHIHTELHEQTALFKWSVLQRKPLSVCLAVCACVCMHTICYCMLLYSQTKEQSIQYVFFCFPLTEELKQCHLCNVKVWHKYTCSIFYTQVHKTSPIPIQRNTIPMVYSSNTS